MPFRPPLVAHEYFVADPPELPRRAHGDPGPQSVRRAELISVDGNGVTLKAMTESGMALHAQVTAAGDGIIRVRLSTDPTAQSRSARMLPLTRPDLSATATVITATATDDDVTATNGAAQISSATGAPVPATNPADPRSITLTAGRLTAEIRLDPWRLRFLDSGRVLVETDPGLVDISGRQRTLPFGCSTVDGGIAAYHESFVLAAGECLTGTGERFLPLNLRGQRPLMWNFDAFGSESDRAYKNVPFYQSSRGYGVVVDSGMPVEFDFGASTQSSVQLIVPDDLLDYYILAGPTPADILDRYNSLTGRPVCPPKWAFGSWISSGFFRDSQKAVLARAATIREHGIPCDVLHLDTYWQPDGRWSELSWDTEAFPEPEAMLAQLHERGFRVCLWMNPYLSRHSPRFTEAAEKGYLLKHADGSVYIADSWHGSFPSGGIIDFTNPEATAWFKGLVRTIAQQGVDVFKTDFAEGVPADAVAHNGMSGTELHNIYSLLYNDAVAEVTREVNGHSTVWARSSYLGGQRHAAQWSGDSMCSYPALASTINGGLAHGMSGVPYWSHDAGGFSGVPDDELFLRWSQFGALSPLLRFHGTTTREPWRFPAVEQLVVEALRLRYRLLPYLYTAALRSARTGEPMMRAMMVDSPDDACAWRAEYQYRLGPSLIVAPVVGSEQQRDVYLPGGDWVDWWTGEVHTGPAMVRVNPPLDRLPLFVASGSLIPTIPAAERIPDGPWPAITLLSFGGVDATADIGDDGGVTTVVARRTGDAFHVTSRGPARIAAVEFAPVFGASAPSSIHIEEATK